MIVLLQHIMQEDVNEMKKGKSKTTSTSKKSGHIMVITKKDLEKIKGIAKDEFIKSSLSFYKEFDYALAIIQAFDRFVKQIDPEFPLEVQDE